MNVRPSKKLVRPTVNRSESSCMAVRQVLNIVGDKWSILIVGTLESGTLRFSEIQRSIEGISQRMLTRTLRELERFGLINRVVKPTVPPSVYYSLTPNGRTLLEPMKNLAGWALKQYPEIEAAKKRFDTRTHESG